MSTPSLSTILNSQVGQISIKTIDISEKDRGLSSLFLMDDGGYDTMMGITDSIEHNPELALDPVITTEIKRVLKSCSMPETAWFWIRICRKFPALWEEIERDPMIHSRAKHVRKVCAISEMFSDDNLETLNDGIQSVRQRLFEQVTS